MVLTGISNVFPDFLEITAFDFVCQSKKKNLEKKSKSVDQSGL